MESDLENNFYSHSEKNAFDREGYEKSESNFLRYEQRHSQIDRYYTDLNLLYDRASYIRSKGMNDLEKYLKDFEINFSKNGGKIIWATDVKEAITAITQIINAFDAKKIITTHSETLREIYLKKHFGLKKDIIETAFRDFIAQIAQDDFFDLSRKNNKDIAQLLHEKYDTRIDPSSRSLTRFICSQMQNHFFDSDIAITGANFLIADIGGVALCENEGNISRACAFPKVHIVVTGYDKIIPSIRDIELFWTLFSASGTGKVLNAYNNIILGPKNAKENDGPEEMYVIILNAGRDSVLKQREQRKALNCIHCKACSRYCPVWRSIGEKAYYSFCSGPIGCILVPLMKDSKKYHYLTYASSLSAKPEQHCPVRIPLNNLLLCNRALFIKERRMSESSLRDSTKQQSLYLLGNRVVLNFDWRGKNKILSSLIKNKWGKYRALPKFAKKSYNELYKAKSSDNLHKKES